MKLLVVFDLKGGVPVLAGCYPNKDVFIRQLLAVSGDKDMIFNQFPEDYVLIETSVSPDDTSFSFDISYTADFSNFIKKESVSNDEEG